MKDDSSPVIFTHIPKTAGYTMHSILHREYVLKSGAIFDSDNIGKINAFKVLPESFRKKLILVKGHLYYGAHQYIPRTCIIFYISAKATRTYCFFIQLPAHRA